MKIDCVKKVLTIVVITLFLGVAFAPSIHANISKESELIEITTEICGLPGQKPQTVQLTKENAEAVDRLFEEIKTKLDAVELREEAVEIFNEAIVELDKYGLLGGLSIRQAQQLVTGRYHRRLSPLPMDENENRFCLIIGRTDNTFFTGFIAGIVQRLMYYFSERSPVLSALLELYLVIPLQIINTFQPLFVSSSIGFFAGGAEGWVRTIGFNGVMNWSGLIQGQIETAIGDMAVVGFTGIKILLGDLYLNFYLGFARHVKIEEVE